MNNLKTLRQLGSILEKKDSYPMILVTGATGFVGSFVVRALIAEQQDVLAVDLSRDPESKEWTSICRSKKLQFIPEFDIRDEESVGTLFRDFQFETVIHLASILNRASIQDPAYATDVNILGSLNILEASCYAKVNRFIYGSSISVYGGRNRNGKSGIRETDPALPQDIYGASKRYIEQLGKALTHHYDLEFISLRIPVVVGPGAFCSTSPWRSDIFDKLSGQAESSILFPFVQDLYVPLVHARDLAEIFTHLVAAPFVSHGIYNCPADTLTIGEIGDLVCSLNSLNKCIYGNKTVTEIPSFLNSKRISDEFKLSIHSIEDRMLEHTGKID